MTSRRILVTGSSGFIGTNLVERLRLYPDISIAGLDIATPQLQSHQRSWSMVDVRDVDGIVAALREFEPDAVIHLAARTDLSGISIDDYSTNTEGTARLLEALDAVGYSGSAIFTSSMYVCRPGYRPLSDTDFRPHTLYGESKVVSEQTIRTANPNYRWTIARPTSIWGPWFRTPYADFFNIVLSRRYLHIAGNSTRKTYGYVGNVVEQLLAILTHSVALHEKVVYLGDWTPYLIEEWADEIAEFVPYKVPRVPYAVLKALALAGDAIQVAGLSFPMTSFRLRNMTTDNVHDLRALEDLMGSSLPYSRAEGNAATIEWLRGRSSKNDVRNSEP